MTTAALTARERARANYMNLMLWTFQGWIAMFFVAAGYAKLTESIENLTVLMQWPALVPLALVRCLGVMEIVLALMVLSPLVSWRFGRPLLILASVGLVALQALMTVVHLIGWDFGLVAINLMLLAITVPVLWFRRRA